MANPAATTILSRIRLRLTEATARFYSDAELIAFYNDGADAQHAIVMAAARQQDRLCEVENPYLTVFSRVFRINVVSGTQLYAIPGDFEEAFQFSLSNPSNTVELFAQYVDAKDEWLVRHIPHMGPTYDRPMYSFKNNPDATGSAMRLVVYTYGNNGVPNTAWHGRLYYYRDHVRATVDGTEEAGNGGLVMLPDPYNEGPIWYAVAEAMAKRGTDPSPYMQLFANAAQSIMVPIAASTASTADAQAKGAQEQTR